MGRPMIIDSDVLRERVKIHLAMLNEIGSAARLTLFPCGYCTNHIESAEDCKEAGGECKVCKKFLECPCSGCHGDSENFEWRGVVEANAPKDIEVENFIRAIAKEVSE